jgi:hypothetical protein
VAFHRRRARKGVTRSVCGAPWQSARE